MLGSWLVSNNGTRTIHNVLSLFRRFPLIRGENNAPSRCGCAINYMLGCVPMKNGVILIFDSYFCENIITEILNGYIFL